MAAFEKIFFVIPVHTPETMPLNRLLEYLQQIALVIGHPEKLHLMQILEGSCEPVFYTDVSTSLAVQATAQRLQRGEGNKRQFDGLNQLRRMLREDGVSDKPAILRSSRSVFLQIQAAPRETSLSGIRQASSVDGALIKIGGASDTANIQLQDISGKILSGFTASRSLAKDLAHHMWDPVRLHGTGFWGRDDSGRWNLEKMQVNSFDVLEDESLSVTLAKLRSVNVTWPVDAVERLLAERNEEM